MNNTLKTILIILVVGVTALGSFAGGFVTGHLLPVGNLPGFPAAATAEPAPTAAPEQNAITPTELQNTFAPFWEVWNAIHENYVEQPVDDLTLMRGAISGMMDTLKVGRNYYYDPKTLEEQDAALNGKDYEGIGAYVDVDKAYLTVISPIKGSPAEKAGLRPGDQIIAINGEDMTGVPPEEARQKVLGPGGTEVTLTILRKGEDAPFDVKIVRAKIITPLVEYEMRDDGLAYIRLVTFGDTANVELKKALNEVLAQNPKGLIFDLRNNGGGYLDQGIAVASEFLPDGEVVVAEKFGDGNLTTYKASGGGLALDIPMVVLINDGSASASEIVAGAIQDYGRAKLIGTQSYGKGSVQSLIKLQNQQGAIGVTIALWLTPKERSIEGIGLTPDIYVEITEDDFAADRDPQLDAAAQALLAILNGGPLPTSMPTPVFTPTPVHTP